MKEINSFEDAMADFDRRQSQPQTSAKKQPKLTKDQQALLSVARYLADAGYVEDHLRRIIHLVRQRKGWQTTWPYFIRELAERT